jgi:pimeloyl-ACP methyl ester carboxylesterase
MKDIAFRPKELNVFKEFLKNREVIVLNDVGHYVQDEAADRIIEPIKEFLKK